MSPAREKCVTILKESYIHQHENLSFVIFEIKMCYIRHRRVVILKYEKSCLTEVVVKISLLIFIFVHGKFDEKV